MLVNPRFGRRRCKGIWPPSKPRIMREPERERWPLWPRAEVLPMPLPMPRPTRFLFDVAPLGGLKVDKFVGTWISSIRNRRSFVTGADYSVSLLLGRAFRRLH